MNTKNFQVLKNEISLKYIPGNLFVETDKYEDWIKKDDIKLADIPLMPPLEGEEEEIKDEKGKKILTPKKLLTKLSILFTQIKTGNNSYTLKNEIRQVLYLIYQHNKINITLYNSLIKSL